ncbi:AAA family ATPase [Leadbetterella sp. DM7]|uniref:AAA family ATPase n=1 Tax=Leadbetterella sp. DM7 TaxID=3235085 RepID=UPI00349EE714
MSRIRIKNFGPIKEGSGDDWIDIKKVTVFIGNQGSGKSTVAKLISLFTWIEKVLTRGDYNPKYFERKGRLVSQYFAYHRIENYFMSTGKDITEIEYQGDAYHFKYEKQSFTITERRNGEYPLPQIMYVPAERNFIANVKKASALKLTSDSLIEFVTEYDNAKNEIKGAMQLPVNNVSVEYDKLNDIVNLKGKDYKLKLTEASSGFQSIVPLYLVSRFLAYSVNRQSVNKEPISSDELERFRKNAEAILADKNLTDDQKRVAISALSKRFNKSAFINIVEEPEQNLFPSSQWELLKKLLEFNNLNKGNKLIMTTHSPYLINYLSIAIQADYLSSRIAGSHANELLKEVEKNVPKESFVKDVVIYQLDETNGSISKLPNTEGIPSDRNYLNESLKHGNLIFDNLLEIEQEL